MFWHSVLVHRVTVTPSYVQQRNAVGRGCWRVILSNCNLQTREVNLGGHTHAKNLGTVIVSERRCLTHECTSVGPLNEIPNIGKRLFHCRQPLKRRDTEHLNLRADFGYPLHGECCAFSAKTPRSDIAPEGAPEISPNVSS